MRLGLVTAAPDELDWADEIRIALEERASLSPDALTGMEANLRFGGAETMETRDLRPAFGVAELDLHPAERGRRKGRAEGVRHRQQAAFDWDRNLDASDESLTMSIDYATRFRTTSTSPATARCSARSSTGSRASSTGGRHGPRRRAGDRRLPAHRDQRRSARLGAVRLREDAGLPLGHLPRAAGCRRAR